MQNKVNFIYIKLISCENTCVLNRIPFNRLLTDLYIKICNSWRWWLGQVFPFIRKKHEKIFVSNLLKHKNTFNDQLYKENMIENKHNGFCFIELRRKFCYINVPVSNENYQKATMIP